MSVILGGGWKVKRIFLALCLAAAGIHFLSLKEDFVWVKSHRVGGSLRPSTKSYLEKLRRQPKVFRCSFNSCQTRERRAQQRIEVVYEERNVTAKEGALCPNYFKWIKEDLAVWEESGGISRGAVDAGLQHASFRVVILGGRLYVEPYHPCYQTRAFFTVWGLLQLLHYYPNRVPDVDLAFSCEDPPAVPRSPPPFPETKPAPPPIIFRYCSSPPFFDVPFPDWSFWGWPEVNIRPWDMELADIIQGSMEVPWINRRNVAYWKGNPFVTELRRKLLQCNSSDYDAEIYIQNWTAEIESNFTKSRLAQQCKHRYKIYAEGSAWSASLKYIVACDSPVLIISPEFHEFYTRGLLPKTSYWPVRRKEMCKSIKFAVEWGNAHPSEVEGVGKSGQAFISGEVDMAHVYDYMLHLLTEYAKLQEFKVSVPEKAAEVCIESVLCLAEASEKPFLEQSLVKAANTAAPCRLPSSFDAPSVSQLLYEKSAAVMSVEESENETWKSTPPP